MPAAAIMPAALGIGGSLLGAIGGSKKQGSQQQSGESHSTSSLSGNQYTSQNTTGTTTPIEEGYFSDFRKSLIPQFNSAMYKAQQPLYGKAEQAGFMQNLNDLASGSINSLKQTLAKSGAMDSGRFGAGVTNIQMDRLGKAAQYNANVPKMNQDAYMQNVGNLLGLGMNFAGRAPLGQTTTGQASGTMNSTQNGTQDQNYKSLTDIFGPSAGGAFMNSLGGMLGMSSQGKGPLAPGMNWLSGLFG